MCRRARARQKPDAAPWTVPQTWADSIVEARGWRSTMKPSIPDTMKAAAIDRFGGPEVIQTRSLPIPKPGANEGLIRLATAGIGVWDPYFREGEAATADAPFPRVIGNDGAGTVVAAGER